MEKVSYFKVLRLRKNRIIFITVVTFILSLALSFLQPLKYSCSTRLLIINKSGLEQDIYSAIRGAERVSENLAQIVYTTSFFERVITSGFDIDQSIFSDDEIKKRKQWNRMIKTRVYRETGMLEIIVYHKNPDQSIQFSRAIADVLTTQGWRYLGGENIEVLEVDKPLVSRYPVKPNIPLNGFMGIVVGLLIGIGYVLLSYESGKAKVLAYETQAQTAGEGYGEDSAYKEHQEPYEYEGE